MLRGKMMDVHVCEESISKRERGGGERESIHPYHDNNVALFVLLSNLGSCLQRASRDERAFVSHICSSMNSEAVGLMLYPRLMSFPDLDSESPVDDLFVLSHAAIDQNSQQLYLLDSLTEILVFYPRAAKGSVPFPPPVDSGIRYAPPLSTILDT
jgi:hypothetical protein